MEIWKDIVNFEDSYQVSSIGRVKSKTRMIKNGKGFRTLEGQILKGDINRYGYINYRLWKHNKLFNMLGHRLVAVAFIDNHDNKKEVNHKNGIKNDNVIENLEWNTRNENTSHAFKTGLEKPKKGLISEETFKAIKLEIAKGRKKIEVLEEFRCTRRVFEYREKVGFRYN
jgi:hypothetical protein